MKNEKMIKDACTPPFPTIRAMLSESFHRYAARDAYRYPVDDGEKRISYRQLSLDVDACASFLASRGLTSQTVAVIGENSYAYIVAYLTVLSGDGVFTPIDKELPAADTENLILRSGCRAVFASPRYLSRLQEFFGTLVSPPLLFSLGDGTPGVPSFAECLNIGKEARLSADYFRTRADNGCALLVFTSGTTGASKGVMLSEHNLRYAVHCGLMTSCLSGRNGLSVLPYNHTYEAVCDILVSLRCGNCLFINDNVRHVMMNMQKAHPDYVYLVPAFANLFYDNIRRSIRKNNKEAAFRRALRVSAVFRRVGIDLRPLLFREIRRPFGGKLSRIVCGGAPIRKDVGEFFDAVGMTLTGGYGITECSPLVSVNDTHDCTFDTAGKKLPCLEWKIDAPDRDGTGEILVRGDTVMLGYFHDDAATANAFADGWFKTGDFGRITSDGRLAITGRKKNIIILSNGKNIYPEEIEERILAVPYIVECMVRGKKNEFGEEDALTAEIYLGDGVTVGDTSAILRDIRATLTDLPSYKSIHDVIVRAMPFPKTSTKKIRRFAVS